MISSTGTRSAAGEAGRTTAPLTFFSSSPFPAARSKWWFEKFYIIEGLYRGIVRERRDEAEVSQELTLQSKALAGRWPGFGEAPIQH
jgi:hypothetical protein